MSKFNLKILLAIIYGVIKVVVDVLSNGVPADLDDDTLTGNS